MPAIFDNAVTYIRDNKHIYGDKRNIVTLTLWGVALLSHAILLPMLVRELYDNFTHKKNT